MTPAGTGAAQRYGHWLIDSALPVWATEGFDAASERFHERLAFDARPIDVPHRSMVQARQIYVYAHAFQRGWYDDGARLADVAMRSLVRDFCDESGSMASFAFSITSRGARRSDVCDAYAHAFVLFAIAWLHRSTGDPGLLRLAAKTNAFLKRYLVDTEHGGVFDSHPVVTREKRQNPLMHLLEAYLALERSAPGHGYLADATALVDTFRARLFDDARGVLPEYYEETWAAHRDADRAMIVEPGHHFEWVWLLREYSQLSGDDTRAMRDRLFASAHDHGIDADGLIIDEMRADFTPLKHSHRIWPHTEAIKAAAARQADGDEAAVAFADDMASQLLGQFLDRPFEGGWIDHIDASGAPLVDYVPASSLYHLSFAASEITIDAPHATGTAQSAPGTGALR
ncbi:MAG TPA: AGE family epimerase/isomerase [Gemmatimonadaceae bacterium]|nr:AGE family epimerase/isomerase [Gemmatimonadaceae bacterium]